MITAWTVPVSADPGHQSQCQATRRNHAQRLAHACLSTITDVGSDCRDHLPGHSYTYKSPAKREAAAAAVDLSNTTFLALEDQIEGLDEIRVRAHGLDLASACLAHVCKPELHVTQMVCMQTYVCGLFLLSQHPYSCSEGTGTFSQSTFHDGAAPDCLCHTVSGQSGQKKQMCCSHPDCVALVEDLHSSSQIDLVQHERPLP